MFVDKTSYRLHAERMYQYAIMVAVMVRVFSICCRCPALLVCSDNSNVPSCKTKAWSSGISLLSLTSCELFWGAFMCLVFLDL